MTGAELFSAFVRVVVAVRLRSDFLLEEVVVVVVLLMVEGMIYLCGEKSKNAMRHHAQHYYRKQVALLALAYKKTADLGYTHQTPSKSARSSPNP